MELDLDDPQDRKRKHKVRNNLLKDFSKRNINLGRYTCL
jgi:hypothetical protein